MYKLLRGPIVAPFAESSHFFIWVTIADIQNNEMHRSAANRLNALPLSQAWQPYRRYKEEVSQRLISLLKGGNSREKGKIGGT